MAFYKLDDNETLHHVQAMHTPDGYLSEDTKENFTLPYNGWNWFDDEMDALTALTTDDDPTEAALKQWWADLDTDEQKLVYCHAGDSLLAWERREYEVMFSLILANETPELAELKAQVSTML